MRNPALREFTIPEERAVFLPWLPVDLIRPRPGASPPLSVSFRAFRGSKSSTAHLLSRNCTSLSKSAPRQAGAF